MKQIQHRLSVLILINDVLFVIGMIKAKFEMNL